MTDVTILIPTIPPREGVLGRALMSAWEQTVECQVIVQADLDGDGSRITRNKALERVGTEWVAFLDDDDTLYPHHVETLLAAATPDVDLVYPWFDGLNCNLFRRPVGARMLHPKGHPFDADAADYIQRKGNFIPVTVLARTEKVREAGGFQARHPGEERCVDWGLWAAMLRNGSWFAHAPEVTWTWRSDVKHTSGQPWNW